MLAFFRRIRKQLVDNNSTRRYVVYALGEILLVMIGILLALQVNNWNQKRIEGDFEYKLLTELLSTIIDDYRLMDMSINGNQRTIRSSAIILSHFDEDLPYHDSLALHFETTNIWWTILLRTNAYENAKTHGLYFIKDDDTRNLLSGLYEQNLEFGRTMDERQSLYYYSTVTPILTELFESNDKSWNLATSGNVPNDYEKLKNEKRYRNILKTNIGERKHFNDWLLLTLANMKDLEERLQNELDRFK